MFTLRRISHNYFLKESPSEWGEWFTKVLKNTGNTVAESELVSRLGKKIITFWDKEKEELIDRTEAAIRDLKIKSPDYYRLLVMTEAISEDRVSLARRWLDGSGAWESWARALLSAIEQYNQSHIPVILTYSNKKYSAIPLGQYEETIRRTPDQFNANSLWQGLLKLAIDGDKLFNDETWWAVWAYCEKRGWNSNIIGGNPKVKEFLEKKFLSYEEQKSHVLEATKWAEWQRQFKEDPRFAEFLRQKSFILPNGRIDVKKAIDTFSDKSPDGIINGFNTLASKLSQELTEITKKIVLKEWELKEKWINNLKELSVLYKIELPNLPPHLLSLMPKGWRLTDIQANLKIVTRYRDAHLANPEVVTVLNQYIDILISQEQILKKKAQIEEAKKRKSQAEEAKKRWANTTEQVVEYLTSKPQEEEADAVHRTALVRAELITNASILEERYQIRTYEEAQKKYRELEEIARWRELTEEEKALRLFLEQNFQIRRDQVILHRSSIETLGREKAEKIFLETNRSLSWNQREQYDFRQLEKASVLLDPESTTWDKALANLEPWKAISFAQIFEWNQESSLRNNRTLESLSLSLNEDGTFDVPAMSLKKISQEELRELKSNIGQFARIGLLQFVPHMKAITGMMRQAGINVAIDGKSDTTEQIQIAKFLFQNLFWRSILSDSLSEVEHEFSASLGNPTNLEVAMQSILLRHTLISLPDGPVSAERIERWINGNKQISTESMLRNMD